eukprot:767753-Hanusia_phi.AAC.3
MAGSLRTRIASSRGAASPSPPSSSSSSSSSSSPSSSSSASSTPTSVLHSSSSSSPLSKQTAALSFFHGAEYTGKKMHSAHAPCHSAQQASTSSSSSKSRSTSSSVSPIPSDIANSPTTSLRISSPPSFSVPSHETSRSSLSSKGSCAPTVISHARASGFSVPRKSRRGGNLSSMVKEGKAWIRTSCDPWWVELIGQQDKSEHGNCMLIASESKEQGKRVTFDQGQEGRDSKDEVSLRRGRSFFGQHRSAAIFSSLERMLEEAEDILDPPCPKKKEERSQEGGDGLSVCNDDGRIEGEFIAPANPGDEITDQARLAEGIPPLYCKSSPMLHSKGVDCSEARDVSQIGQLMKSVL